VYTDDLEHFSLLNFVVIVRVRVYLMNCREVDPSWMMGIIAGWHPWSSENQVPRSILASSMTAQAPGLIPNPQRISTLQYQLEYPQFPIANTRISQDYDLPDLCLGMVFPAPHSLFVLLLTIC